jgi:FtsP/CotA-like multicopper oxidase with cupredoxin domain
MVSLYLCSILVCLAQALRIGTFWNHAHARGQYVDGLRSPTTISRKGEEYEYDDDYTVILGDW